MAKRQPSVRTVLNAEKQILQVLDSKLGKRFGDAGEGGREKHGWQAAEKLACPTIQKKILRVSDPEPQKMLRGTRWVAWGGQVCQAAERG